MTNLEKAWTWDKNNSLKIEFLESEYNPTSGMLENALKEKLISIKSDLMMTWVEPISMASETSRSKEINRESLEYQPLDTISLNLQDRASPIPT